MHVHVLCRAGYDSRRTLEGAKVDLGKKTGTILIIPVEDPVPTSVPAAPERPDDVPFEAPDTEPAAPEETPAPEPAEPQVEPEPAPEPEEEPGEDEETPDEAPVEDPDRELVPARSDGGCLNAYTLQCGRRAWHNSTDWLAPVASRWHTSDLSSAR
jgi:hypothetical protein